MFTPSPARARLRVAQLPRGAVDFDHCRVDAARAAGPDACPAQPGGEPWQVLRGVEDVYVEMVESVFYLPYDIYEYTHTYIYIYITTYIYIK